MARHIAFLPLIMLLLLVTAERSHANSRDFSIRLGHNSPRERAAEEQLRQLLDRYDVRRYSFTYSILINEGDVPHSHPVLTLNTVHLGDDANALSTFLHEQLHWYSLVMAEATEAAIADLKALYPRVPVGRGLGAYDAYATYVHLIVCLQEYDALASYIGRDAARQVMEAKPHYRWIYRQVLENTATLRRVLAENGLDNVGQF